MAKRSGIGGQKKDPAAVALGRKGGKAKVAKGLAMLPDERKREIAQQGVAARRAKAKGKKK